MGHAPIWLRAWRDSLCLKVLLIAAVFFVCGNASAQTTGSLLGAVSDPAGAVVSAATVQATNTDTGFTTSTTVSTKGAYSIPSLPVGHYTLKVTAHGFRTFVQSGILVPVAQNIRVDVKLRVGEVDQTVSVSGDTVNINTTDATLGATVDAAHLEGLPLNGRVATGLLAMLPGVAVSNAPIWLISPRSGALYSISGSRTDFGNMMLDGQVLTDAISNTSQNLPTVDALGEFRVLTDTYGADYGRAAGSQIVAITKSGTNQFHGALWEYLRNDAFDAANAFTPPGTKKPLLRMNQFGGNLGGPVLLPKYNGRNRTFFFVAYEGLRIHQQDLTTAYPLTAAERTGDFSALLNSPTPQVITDQITNPVTGVTTYTPFPGNIIPQNRIDTVATNVMNLYLPLPNQPDGSLRLAQSAPVTSNEVVYKIDQTLGARDRVSFRSYRSRSSSPTPEPIPFWNDPQTYNYQAYALTETHTFRPDLINEAAISYSRPEGIIGTEKNGQSAQQLGINANGFTPYPQTPQFSVNGDFSLGTDAYTDEPSYFRQFNDTLTWHHGKHDMHIGFLFLYEGNGDLVYPPTSFSFTGLNTSNPNNPSSPGNPMADFLLGRPQSFSVTSTIIDNGTSKQFQPFFQDNYKLTPRVTVDLGLRYDLQTPWTEKAGGASTYMAGKQSTVYPSAPPGLVVPGDKGVSPGIYKTWKWGFEPRIGFAWDVMGNGRTSVRAGWGIYHAAINQEVESVETNNEPFLVSFSTTPHNTENPWNGQTDPLPYNPKNPSFGPFPGITQSSLDPNYRPAEVDQFNLNVQHRFGADFFAEVAYVGGVAHHLYDSRELNAAVYAPGATEACTPIPPATVDNNCAQSRRPILPTIYGSIPGIFSDGNSNYNSLQANLQKRFSKSYAIQVTYTWEKSIDTRSQSLIGSGPQNPNDWEEGERGLSDFNVGQILAINGLWEIPAPKSKGLLTAVVGGWQLNGIVRYGSGNPFSVLTGQDNALIGYSRTSSGQERANVNGNPNLSMSRSRSALAAEYFNTTAFSQPAPGQFGTSRRNSMVGPGYFQNDISVKKKIPVLPAGRGGFEFRADIFNLINWTNLGALDNSGQPNNNGQPVNNLSSQAFGKITSAGDPRIVQFALRFDF